MSVKIDGLTAAEYQGQIDQLVDERGGRVPMEFLPVGGYSDRAYVLRSNHRDETSRSVLCAWRGQWVAWVQSYETGSLYWGRYGQSAERAHADRCSEA